MPPARRSSITFHVARRASGSIPVVGSSRKSTSGADSTASARSSLRFWPPESCRTLVLALVSRPTSSSAPMVRRSTPLARPMRVNRPGNVVVPDRATGRPASSLSPFHRSTVSATVRSPRNPPSCSMIPTRRRSSRRCRIGSRPSTRTVPSVAGVKPSSTSIVVVLPAPFVPSRAKISPLGTVKETPRTASKSPYLCRNPPTSITLSRPAASVPVTSTPCRNVMWTIFASPPFYR